MEYQEGIGRADVVSNYTALMFHPDMNLKALRLFNRINWLCNAFGYCYAGNADLAYHSAQSEKTVERNLKLLENLNFIERETVKIPYENELGKQKFKIRRIILITLDKNEIPDYVPMSKTDENFAGNKINNIGGDPPKNCRGGYSQKCSNNNRNRIIDNNNFTNRKIIIVPNPKNFDKKSEAYQLAQLLFSEIRKNHPNYKPNFTEKDMQRWASDADKMLRIDKRDYKLTRELILWVQNDDFESTVVLSIAKLRKRYDDLLIKKDRKYKSHNSKFVEEIRHGKGRNDFEGIGDISGYLPETPDQTFTDSVDFRTQRTE